MPGIKDAVPVYENAPVRSIETDHSIDIERLHSGKPILKPNPVNHWESKVVLNPGVVLVKDLELLEAMMGDWNVTEAQKQEIRAANGAAVMLYRAQGEVEKAKGIAPSYTGLAVFTPDLKMIWRKETPVISPDASFHNLGVEDGRCSFIDGKFYFLYTGYFYDKESDSNRVQICLGITENFIDWDLRGPVKGDINDVDNKNSVLFPEKINNKWVMLHRPMQGPNPKAIHWATADAIDGRWKSQGMLMASYRFKEFRESWIGAGGPPISIGDGKFLTIYHQGHFFPNNDREYNLSATIIEFLNTEAPKIHRRLEPLMRPTGADEQEGDKNLGVDNVLFTCANYIHNGNLIIPYAGADSRIFGAKLNLNELVHKLEL